MNDGTGRKKRSLQRVAKKAILFGALAILLMSVIVEVVLFLYPTMENYKREMDHESNLIVDIIGPEFLEKKFSETRELYYSIPEEIRAKEFSEEYVDLCLTLVDDEFYKARELLKKCRAHGDFVNVFFSFYDEETDRLVYVVDGNEGNMAFLPGQWISNENGVVDSPEKIKKTVVSGWYMPITYSKVYGMTGTDYNEVYDSQGNLLGYITMNVSVNAFARQIGVFLTFYVPVMILVMIVTAIMAERWISFNLINPIKKMAGAARKYTAMGKVGTGKAASVFKELHIDTDDEIEELWDTMVDMEEDVANALEQVRKVAAREERISAELDLARAIQAAALPRDFDDVSGNDRFELYASMTPAKEVGGDFYDFFTIDEDHVALVIADVSGKGIPAALIMMIVKTLIKNAVVFGGRPSIIMEKINNSFCRENVNDMFATVWLGILTVSTGEILACNAGHEYPFITDENGEFCLFKDTHGVVLGALPDMDYSDYIIKLPKGGKIFVYTDGVTEAQNEGEQLYGLERLRSSLNRCRESDPEELLKAVRSDIDSYAGNADQFDDLTMLCLHYRGC